MPPNAFYATLAQSLAQNGSEAEVYLSNITTLTGETINTAQFATFGRGIITVDPLVSTSIESISFTGVDATGVGLTGASRGLSALSNSTVTANKKYHPVGAQVIIAFGVHNIIDLKTYIDGAVSGSLGTATDSASGSAKVSFPMGSIPRARGALVSQQASPNMTLKVNPFGFAGNNLNINYAGGNTSAMVAPVSNPRIDLVVYDTNASGLAVRTGTEAVSPVAPTPTTGDILLALVYHRTGETTLIERDTSPNTQGYIQSWYEPTLYTTPTPVFNTALHDATTDQTQGTQNSSITVGEANVTTKHSLVAQKFVAGKTSIKGARLWKAVDTGSFTGTVKVALQADSSGSPSGVDLASFTISNAAWLKLTNAAELAVAFTTEYGSLVVGTSYWLVLSCSTGDSSNHPNFGINTAGGYASGALKYNNSTDGWVLVATSMLYFKTLEGVTSKIIETDASEGLPLAEVRPYQMVVVDVASATYTGDTSAHVAYSKQLEGGFLTANAGLRIKISFTFTGSGSGTAVAVKVRYNGSDLINLSSPTVVTSNGFNVGTFILDAVVLNQASASSQKNFGIVAGWYTASTGTPTTAAGLMTPTTVNSTTAVDLSQPALLEVTFTNNNSAGSTTYNGLYIEKIAA